MNLNLKIFRLFELSKRQLALCLHTASKSVHSDYNEFEEKVTRFFDKGIYMQNYFIL